MNLTPSQRLVFNLLQDGYPHTKDELRTALKDDWMEDNAIYKMISTMRAAINHEGFEVVFRRGAYRLTRLLHSAYDGKR